MRRRAAWTRRLGVCEVLACRLRSGDQGRASKQPLITQSRIGLMHAENAQWRPRYVDLKRSTVYLLVVNANWKREPLCLCSSKCEQVLVWVWVCYDAPFSAPASKLPLLLTFLISFRFRNSSLSLNIHIATIHGCSLCNEDALGAVWRCSVSSLLLTVDMIVLFRSPSEQWNTMKWIISFSFNLAGSPQI